MKQLFCTLIFLLFCNNVYAEDNVTAPKKQIPDIGGKESYDPKKVRDNLTLGKANSDTPVLNTGGKANNLMFEEELKAPTTKKQQVQKEQRPIIRDEYEYSDEVVLNWIRHADMETKRNVLQKPHNYKVAFYTPEKKDDKDQNKTALANVKDVNQTLDGTSFKCLVNKDIEVRGVKSTMMMEAVCKSDDNVYAQIGIRLTPDNEHYALLGKAEYMVNEAGTYYVLDGNKSMVRNIDGSDANIASTVNTRTLEKFNATVKKEMSKAMSDSAKEYMEEDKAYRKNSSSIITQNGTVVTTTDNQKPDVSTNIVYGLVQGILGVVEKTQDAITSDLPYLYKVEKGSIINVFAVIQTTQQIKNNMQKSSGNNATMISNTSNTTTMNDGKEFSR